MGQVMGLLSSATPLSKIPNMGKAASEILQIDKM